VVQGRRIAEAPPIFQLKLLIDLAQPARFNYSLFVRRLLVRRYYTNKLLTGGRSMPRSKFFCVCRDHLRRISYGQLIAAADRLASELPRSGVSTGRECSWAFTKPLSKRMSSIRRFVRVRLYAGLSFRAFSLPLSLSSFFPSFLAFFFSFFPFLLFPFSPLFSHPFLLLPFSFFLFFFFCIGRARRRRPYRM